MNSIFLALSSSLATSYFHSSTKNTACMFLKLVENASLFRCSHSTPAITVHVCELEKNGSKRQNGGVFALNTDELLATEMMDGESYGDVFTPIHQPTHRSHDKWVLLWLSGHSPKSHTSLIKLLYFWLIVQQISLLLCEISNWVLCHPPREFAISWILTGCHSQPL